ncbi:hypothetical protein [Actinocrispum sp. NPDC049592]|uniref:hypothetical protein n=1 Tax=Actinocrispum sp. NPDC049592 TaxID=3154835 RepID=UPI003426DEFA
MNRPVPVALRIAWRAAAPLLVAFVPLTLLGALAPVATGWSVKLTLDSVIAGVILPALLWLVAGLALAGIVAGVVPHALEYLRAESNRPITVFSEDKLYAATERFVGLGRFQNRLRLAQDSGRSTPGNVITSAVGMSRGLVTAVGFVGSLAIVDPLVTVVVACVPAILAERALADRRAAVLPEMTPAIRREVFYAKLLSDTRAAKEARLFGLGGFFRRRMLAGPEAANAAERGLDQRELRTQGGLSLLSDPARGSVRWIESAARLAGVHEAEHQIHETLRTHAGSTKVLISCTTRDADDIYALADGRVIEHGRHTGLMAAEGEYARLFAMQAKGYQQSDSLV